jgi:hypothetical protein
MQCTGKIKYLDAASAQSAVDRLKRRAPRCRMRNQLLNPPKVDPEAHSNLGVYKCPRCACYHVGHDKPWLSGKPKVERRPWRKTVDVA